MSARKPLKRLGAGHFGQVFLEYHEGLGSHQAVKYVPLQDAGAAQLAYTESQALKALEHPNIVKVEDAGLHQPTIVYIAMEYLPGGSLSSQAQGSFLPLRRAVRYLIDCCRRLQHAHNQGYLHRDIKPGNIMLDENDRAKLSDFGLAAQMDSNGTAPIDIGYWAHWAPEILQGEPTSVATDLYALGVTAYRIINGDAVLPVKSAEDLKADILAGRFPPKSRYQPFVPRAIRRTLGRTCHPTPTSRIGSASELRHALESVAIHCDWHQSAEDQTSTWTAVGLDGQFEVNVTRVRRGNYDVHARSATRTGSLRRRTGDSGKSLSTAQMNQLVSRTLQRVTTTGR